MTLLKHITVMGFVIPTKGLWGSCTCSKCNV